MKQSIFRNVPLHLLRELMKYKTPDSRYVCQWRGRKPIAGHNYGVLGSLKHKHAKTANLYIIDKTKKS